MPPADRDELARIRQALEAADADLVRALDARATAIRSFIELRERDPGGYHQLPPPADVLQRLMDLRQSFPAVGIEPVMREVLSVCDELIAPVRVAVIAPEGGLAHQAARSHFGARASFDPLVSVAEVFAAVERGAASYGMVPLETSSDGTIQATLVALTFGRAKILAERRLRSAYHLYSRTGNAADVERIVAPAAALAACKGSLRTHFPRAALLEMKTGAMATEMAREDHGSAVLGPEVIAEGDSGLRPVLQHLEDDASLETRFVVIGRDASRRTGQDRTWLALALMEGPGSLHGALAPFADRAVNLTRLESRQIPGSPYQELFFLELDGHVTDRNVVGALDDLKSKARHLEILGSYPRPSDGRSDES